MRVALLAALTLAGCGVQSDGGEETVRHGTFQQTVSPTINLSDGQTSSLVSLNLPDDGQYSVSYEFARSDPADEVTLTLLSATSQTLGSVTITPLPRSRLEMATTSPARLDCLHRWAGFGPLGQPRRR